ncbi:MAG: hypothetical protein SFW64_07240 [Alphaproteobacteria bacterium]|nr:hypothetical protein [Alphaproteobacteria bacterium]
MADNDHASDANEKAPLASLFPIMSVGTTAGVLGFFEIDGPQENLKMSPQSKDAAAMVAAGKKNSEGSTDDFFSPHRNRALIIPDSNQPEKARAVFAFTEGTDGRKRSTDRMMGRDRDGNTFVMIIDPPVEVDSPPTEEQMSELISLVQQSTRNTKAEQATRDTDMAVSYITEGSGLYMPPIHGNAVEDLQRQLGAAGFDIATSKAPDGIDGLFGDKTAKAVAAIAAEIGIDPHDIDFTDKNNPATKKFYEHLNEKIKEKENKKEGAEEKGTKESKSTVSNELPLFQAAFTGVGEKGSEPTVGNGNNQVAALEGFDVKGFKQCVGGCTDIGNGQLFGLNASTHNKPIQNEERLGLA